MYGTHKKTSHPVGRKTKWEKWEDAKKRRTARRQAAQDITSTFVNTNQQSSNPPFANTQNKKPQFASDCDTDDLSSSTYTTSDEDEEEEDIDITNTDSAKKEEGEEDLRDELIQEIGLRESQLGVCVFIFSIL